MTKTDFPTIEPIRTRRGWLVLFLLPPLGLLGIFVAWTGFEYREWLAIQAKIQARQTSGQAVTLEQLTQSIYENSNTDGTLAWTTLNRKCDSLTHRLFYERLMDPEHLLVNFASDPNLDKSANNSWLVRTRASGDEFLSYMKPMLDQLDEVAKLPQPIWLPIGSGPIFDPQSAERLRMLVNLDILVGILEHDRSRILSGFERLIKTESLMVENEISRSCSSTVGRLKDRYTLLSFCMQVPGWSPEELAQLESFAKTDADLTKLWQQDVDTWIISSLISRDPNYAMYFNSRSNNNNLIDPFLRATPSLNADILRKYEELAKLSFEDPIHAAREINRLSSTMHRAPAYFSLRYVSGNLVENELLLRLVRCGIAIRRYKLTHGTWPDDLKALNRDLGTTIDLRLPIGYEIGYVLGELGPEIRIFGKSGAGTPELPSDLLTRWVIVPIRDAKE